jgi:hypothetical protein
MEYVTHNGALVGDEAGGGGGTGNSYSILGVVVAYSIGFLRVISQLIKPIAYSRRHMQGRRAKLSYLYIQYGGDCELFHNTIHIMSTQ